MSNDLKAAATTDLPYAGLCCPMCDYNLTGTTEPRCPECGEAFDPTELRAPKSGWRGKPTWRVTLIVVLLAVYLPNTWIFWIAYPWGGGYRMHWVKMFPVLPALVPTAWAMHLTWFGFPYDLDAFWGILTLGSVTAAMATACVLIGRRSRRWLLAVCVVMFMLEVFNALGCYALFRA